MTEPITLPAVELRVPPPAVAFSTQRGGCGAGPYDGFSVCHYTGDAPRHYEECRDRLAARLGVGREALVIPRQTHSARALIVDSLPVAAETLEGVDALVTQQRGIVLCINTADCVPVVLTDPEARVIAAAHCGWRGVVNDLLPETLRLMQQCGVRPARIHAAMGPSICADCFEVGEEVADRFRQLLPGVSGIVMDAAPDASRPNPHVNLGAAIAARLIALGLLPSSIVSPCACSRCRPDLYFSARALTIASGRTLTAITLP